MRTTVTLDPDVEQLIRAAQERGRASFKQVLNDAIRRGLKAGSEEPSPPFEVDAKPMGLRPGIDPARVRDLDDELEIREFLRKQRALEDAAG
jgi:hypothetical protein